MSCGGHCDNILTMYDCYKHICCKTVLSFFIQLLFLGDAAVIDLRISSPTSNFPNKMEGRIIVGPVRCQTNLSLTHCQFRVDQKRIFDLSRGNSTKRSSDFSYYGTGLENGDCGAYLSGELFSTDGGHVIECRVSNDDCDWAYASLAIFSSVAREIVVPMTTSAREIVATPGSPVNLLFKIRSDLFLSECFFKIENQGGWTSLRDGASSLLPEFTYHGRGLREGECGVTIHNVTEEMNGLVWFHLFVKAHERMDFIRLIVAKPPDMPVIEANITTTADGYILHASCAVTGSRPVPSIRWLLDGIEIQSDNVSQATCDLDDDWTWPYGKKTTKKFLTKKISNYSLWGASSVWCSVHNDEFIEEINSTKVNIKNIQEAKTKLEQEDSKPMKQESECDATIMRLVVVIGLLAIILVCGSVSCLVFFWYRHLCCFYQPHMGEGPVNSRQIQRSAIITEDERSTLNQRGQEPMILVPGSSLENLYMESNNEYSEIRISTVDTSKDEWNWSGLRDPGKHNSQCDKVNSIYQE